MKKNLFYLALSFLLLLPYCSFAQNNPYWLEPTLEQADSLKKSLAVSSNDSLSMHINRKLGLYYQEMNRPQALGYFKAMLNLAVQLKQPVWEAEATSRVGYVSALMQNYSGSLKYLLAAEQLASKKDLEKGMWRPDLLSANNSPYEARMTAYADIVNHLGLVHFFTGEYEKALVYNKKFQELNAILKDDILASFATLNRGEAFFGLNQLDSAEACFNKAIAYTEKSGYKKYTGLMLFDIGETKRRKEQFHEAKKYYRLSIQSSIESESPDFEGMGYQVLADLFKLERDSDSLFYFSRKALNIYNSINDTLGLIFANTSLSTAFDATHRADSALYYIQKANALKDGLNKEGRIRSFQLEGFNEQMKLEEEKAAQLQTITKIRTYTFLAGIALLLFIAAMFYRNFRSQRNDKAKIEKAYTELKATQSQLIQAEKMASLGELTAGIAHEIQNPLNFVNNFSEVSKELLDEMKEELDNGNIEDAKEIANDVIANLEKINHHGKRADGIVKGMLQHSRTSSGQKEPTDINVLADEYLRLAYHGLRAKEKSFNATLKTDYDESIGKIEIIPQDIGRVLLNLITNAFYATNEKQNQGFKNYEPTVTVKTQKSPLGGGGVVISVADNGNGIPQKILDKIFQPFFTTKPTGQGTGLGLSLSYDIIKAHGGELKVETKVGDGSAFIISLPV
jgi:signal transduction histidine kinase